MSVEEIEDLKNRIDHLEYKDIKGIREDVNQIKIDQAKIGVITENATKAIEKLNETLDSSKETMIAMAQSIKDSNNISSELTNAVENLNTKVDNIEEKMDTNFEDVYSNIRKIDNKMKVDVGVIVKDAVQRWGILIIIGGAIVYGVVKLFV